MTTKQYLVECEECAFSHTVTGREEAIATGESHSEETAHEITAIELPRNLSA